MKTLLIGRTGQIGRHLEHLLAPVSQVIAPGRAEADLARPDTLRRAVRAVKPDVIVNAAAYTDVDRAEAERDLARAVNAEAPGILAEEAKRADALLVHYSTAFVFDGSSERAYLETDVPNPISHYGRTKLEGEHAVAAAGGACLVLRTNWVYDSRGRNFVTTVLRLAQSEPELRIVHDQVGAPTAAQAAAAATVAIVGNLARARAHCGLYNLTAEGAVTRYEFTRHALELARRHMGTEIRARVRPIATAEFPAAARRPLNSTLATTKIRETFGLDLERWEAQLEACMRTMARDAKR